MKIGPIAWLLSLAIVATAAVVATSRFQPPAGPMPTQVLRHYSLQSAPTIEQVKKLSQLVVLRVPISDVQISELSGFTGGLRLVLAVHGDVEIATDLASAEFDSIDKEKQSAVLLLNRPQTVRPRLDHDKTRIVEIQRSGMWSIVGGQAGESTLANVAMQKAQELLAAAANQEDLKAQACEHTQTVIREFFGAMGWTVTVQWKDPTTTQSAKTLPSHPSI